MGESESTGDPTADRRHAGHAPSGGATATRYIAFVDDDTSLLPAVQAVVDSAFGGAFRVRQKTAGLDAIYDFMAAPPALVILDLKLPDIDGITVLRLLKTDARLARVPVLILSANSNWNMLQVALDAGADAYFYKPFRLETLIDALRDLAPGAALDAGPDDGGPRRLLVIEDHAETAKALAGFLSHPRVTIEMCDDGARGLARALEWKPDAVLLDVLLPTKSGFEAFLDLRPLGLGTTRVLLMSAEAGPRVLALAKQLGAFACFSKPFDGSLRATVLRALRIRDDGALAGGAAPS